MGSIQYFCIFVSLFLSINSAQAIEWTSIFGNSKPQAEDDGGDMIEGGQSVSLNSKTAGEKINGQKLKCDVGQGKIGMCGGCAAGDGKGAKKGSGDQGIVVSNGFAEVIKSGIAKCIADACGLDSPAKAAGAKLYGCGFQDRKTAGGSVSNHARGSAIDLTKIECPGGKTIEFNLQKGGKNSGSLKSAMNKNPKAQSSKGKQGVRACHAHEIPEDGYNKFNKCWSEHVEKSCPKGQGGLLSAAKSQPSPPRGKPDTKRCHHNDHVHFSSCPGKGI